MSTVERWGRVPRSGGVRPGVGRVAGDDTSVHGDQFPIGREGDAILRNERPTSDGGGAWAGAPPGLSPRAAEDQCSSSRPCRPA